MTLSEYAKKYIGAVKYSAKHKEIVDGYNKIKPLPRGYKANYNDDYCAIFVSFIMNKCGVNNAPYECSAYRMCNKAKSNGQFTNNPAPNEIIFYSWKRNGFVNHVGIVESVNGNTITTIEGNYNGGKVGRRTINKNYVYIYGYAKVQNAETTATPTTATGAKKATKTIAKQVIAGKWGNGAERKQRLESAGYNYNEVQTLVNQILKG